MPALDVALTEDDESGGVLAHRPDCPMVARHRVEQRPIMTMLDCKRLPLEVKQHACLLKEEPR